MNSPQIKLIPQMILSCRLNDTTTKITTSWSPLFGIQITVKDAKHL